MPPRPYRTDRTTQLHIRVSPDELEQIQQAAINNNQSTSDYVRSKIMEMEYYVLGRDDERQIVSVTPGNDPLYGYGSWNKLAGPFASWKEAEEAAIPITE